MARILRGFPAFLLLLVVSALLPLALAAPKKPSPAARREDIPFIKCQVCEKIAGQIYQQVKKKEAQISPKKVSEFQIIEIAENVCNLKKEEADWILQIDIVEDRDKLELVEQGIEGQCNSECKTIERACQEVMGYSDTDVAEFVYSTKPSIDSLVNFLCNDLSKACAVKPPPIPEGRIPGEPFIAKSNKEAEMEKILKSMEGMPGAPSMKMYSREDLMNMNFGNEEADGDEDDDEDDDEGNFPGNLGKILKENDSPRKDFKQKILQSIRETGTAVKRHINKVSKQFKNWWSGKKTKSSSSKAVKTEL